MVSLITFFLGLIIGIGIYYWQIHRFNLRLQQILNLLSDQGDNMIALPLITKVRREIVQLQESLGEQQEELDAWKQLFNQIPLGYLQVDQDNQVLWCNQKAQTILRITEWKSDQLSLLLELVRSYELDQLIESTRYSQENQVKTWQFYPGDNQDHNQSLCLKGHAFPLLHGEVGVFIEDVQLIFAETKRREQAISDLTHELRTPLTSIALVTQTLKKRLNDPEKRWISKMHQEIQRLITLTEEWLEISQLNENPAQHLNYQTLLLDELILISWSVVEPLAEQKQVTLDYQGSKNVSIEGDRCRLTQVLINLFDNAIKHSPEHSKILLIVNLLPELLEINVIDAGKGFASEDLPHVFERLYKSDPSRSRQDHTQGSGLGLSLVKAIILAHQGEVKAYNHPDTQGGWLQVILPRLQVS
ncbi:MAG: PAS domain-containing protein [Gloeocapsa sp. DLM2.Bin57]|nr:MAG: PAS domain-containing protein [Gloeocapsa sp. DLM2.Bin57]